MQFKLGGKVGGVVNYSPEDHDEISKHGWWRSGKYCQGNVDGMNVLIHCFLMKPPKGMVVNHKNGNKLDNRRENLEVVTGPDNAKNKLKQKNTSSIYKGVSKKGDKFVAQLRNDNKRYLLGVFATALEAAEAYDCFIVQNNFIHNINFPDKKDEFKTRPLIVITKRKRSSEYIGVSKKQNGYYASVKYNNERKHIKVHESALVCAKAYDAYIVMHKIPRALNFPAEHPDFKPEPKIKTKYIEIDTETVQIIIKSRPGMKALIEKEDYDKVKYFNCVVDQDGYIIITISDRNYKLSRYIMGVTDPDVVVDHIYGDRSDNRKSQLRISDTAKNPRNRLKKEGGTSKYIGVSKTTKGTWQIKVKKNLGTERDEVSAARRRDLYILDNFPDEHFKMNFTWSNDEIEEWRSKLRR